MANQLLAWLKPKLAQVERPLIYLLIGVAAFQWFRRSDSGPKQGSIAADFSLSSADKPSEQTTLASLRGQPVVIDVLASWCSACRSMAPTMADLARAPRKRAVRFIGVAIDTPPQEAAALHSQWNVAYPILLGDAAFSSAYHIKILPTVIVLDAEGKVHNVGVGTTRGSTIEGWLEELGAGRGR